MEIAVVLFLIAVAVASFFIGRWVAEMRQLRRDFENLERWVLHQDDDSEDTPQRYDPSVN
jgi:hypothetical protein